MPWTSKHIKWFVNTGERFTTVDGKQVDVWEFKYEKDEEILSAWAKHFRNHYCLDSEIDYYRRGPNISRADYLDSMKFPSRESRLGPSTRAGDFSEILVADYLEFILKFWVPRTRYGNKTVRDESTKGTDIIGFYFESDNAISPQDQLAIFEAKATFSMNKKNLRLQDAVDDSAKDETRKAESLNAIKQRLFESRKYSDADKVERFQNEADSPYKNVYGAVALFDDTSFHDTIEQQTNSSAHPHYETLMLLVIKGKSMMELVHSLYRRAANEA